MNQSYLDHDALRIYMTLADGGVALARSNFGYTLLAMKYDAVARVDALKSPRRREHWAICGTPAVLEDIADGVDASLLAWLGRPGANGRPFGVLARPRPGSLLLAGLEESVVRQCSQGSTVSVALGGGHLIALTVAIAANHGRLVAAWTVALARKSEVSALDDVSPSIRRGVDLAIEDGSSVARRAHRGAFLNLTRASSERRLHPLDEATTSAVEAALRAA